MREETLFDILNNAEDQIINNQAVFFEMWNTEIKRVFGCDKSFKIEDHISIYGGFKLSFNEYLKLDKCWKHFFKQKGKADNDYVWLRGYGYYECDPQMYTRSAKISEKDLWRKFIKHWNDYEQIEFDNETNELDVFNWMATLSFLEYIFNDLTTLLWFIHINDSEIKKTYNYNILLSNVESMTDEVTNMVANLLKNDCSESKSLIIDNISHVLSNNTLREFLTCFSNHSSFKHGCMRAVREADSLPLVYSAYLLKLSPFCKCTSMKDALFLSNAFGALNIGLLFKNLTKDCIKADHINVHFSQHRADSAQIGESSGEVKILNSGKLSNAHNSRMCVIVIDDCIFTGRSYFSIKKEYEKTNNVYLLPLAVDIQSLKYYNREKRNIEDTYRISEKVLLCAKELGNDFPAFEAFWDWQNFSEKTIQDAKTDYERILHGGDVLLKQLWIRYKDEIEQYSSEQLICD